MVVYTFFVCASDLSQRKARSRILPKFGCARSHLREGAPARGRLEFLEGGEDVDGGGFGSGGAGEIDAREGVRCNGPSAIG